jgi:carboxypeptidase C (cathepsin A)
MRSLLAAVSLLALTALPAFAADTDKDDGSKPDNAKPAFFKPESFESSGSVDTAAGERIDYKAVAGTLVVHGPGYDDAPEKPLGMGATSGSGDDKPGDKATAEAAMSYTAYFKKDAAAGTRPIIFFYNGGPGSSTVWLHMGALAPRRVLTLDNSHTPAAPYHVVNNEYTALDAADLVFIDAPGTGFGRLAGPDKEKTFWGVDQDAHAFAEFITQFLGKYGCWNSPKYIFGESYGTTRSAILANLLSSHYAVDLNGVILLSQILNFDNSPDGPDNNPGNDLPYELALPTYAATAYYHKTLPQMPTEKLADLLSEVETFALTDYAQALAKGTALPPPERDAIIAKLHNFTGLPSDYLDRANLRVTGPMFEKMVLDGKSDTAGRFDTRFAGPTADPLAKEASYDPQDVAISSAYVTAFNDYARGTLHVPADHVFLPVVDAAQQWSFQHAQPNKEAFSGTVNVMPDLAMAMITNPNLKILLNAGYFDLATPYFAAVYEMRHLPIPQKLAANISYSFYESGHMVYAHLPALKQLHESVADFVGKTSNVGAE